MMSSLHDPVGTCAVCTRVCACARVRTRVSREAEGRIEGCEEISMAFWRVPRGHQASWTLWHGWLWGQVREAWRATSGRPRGMLDSQHPWRGQGAECISMRSRLHNYARGVAAPFGPRPRGIRPLRCVLLKSNPLRESLARGETLARVRRSIIEPAPRH